MNSVICTFFERRYAYGVGALANSLNAAGFTGQIHVGYRGALPFWIDQCEPLGDGKSYRSGKLTLIFKPLEIKIHFTNYKPQFMLQLFDELGDAAEKVVYIDPDIVVKCPWSYIEDWTNSHLALCADVNAQCGPDHPLRLSWRRFYEPHGLRFKNRLGVYANAGFVGVPRSCRAFLEEWRRAQELMAEAIGGLQVAFPKDRGFLFHMTDQDAMNAVMDATDTPLSIVGQDGMDFIAGGYIMSHAQGRPKPWDKDFVLSALDGKPPTIADRFYWRHVTTPLALYGAATLAWKRFSLKSACAIGRFTRRQ